MQRLFGPPSGPTPMQPLPRGPFTFGPGPGMMPPSFYGPGPQTAASFMQGTGGRVGLLSRLFGGGAGAGSAISGAGVSGAASGGSFLSSINLGSVLQNTQRIMGITQQVMPMVQQYGPLIRNAPAIWRIMRSQSEPEENILPSAPVAQEPQPIPIIDSSSESSDAITATSQAAVVITPTRTSKVGGMPGPKLYV